jgi:hypothetical protein
MYNIYMSAVDGSEPEAVEGSGGRGMCRLRARASCIRNSSSMLGRIILQDPAERDGGAVQWSRVEIDGGDDDDDDDDDDVLSKHPSRIGYARVRSYPLKRDSQLSGEDEILDNHYKNGRMRREEKNRTRRQGLGVFLIQPSPHPLSRLGLR